jgi:hypothetical protein
MNPFIRMPDHWTPQKVELILDFIDELYQSIWDKYGTQLCLHWDTQPPETDEEDAPDDDRLNVSLPR